MHHVLSSHNLSVIFSQLSLIQIRIKVNMSLVEPKYPLNKVKLENKTSQFKFVKSK